MKIKIINGPNLNMLGIREKGIYGSVDYDGLCKYILLDCQNKSIQADFFQSNSEGAIIDCLHSCYFEKYDGIVINPGAYTHYSYAILDAIKAINIPTVEVHISDISNREDFRKISVTAVACIGQVFGKGIKGYIEAIEMLLGENK